MMKGIGPHSRPIVIGTSKGKVAMNPYAPDRLREILTLAWE